MSKPAEFGPDAQWRSFQTFIAAYLAGMAHRCDVLTISRRTSIAPPLVEFRCDAEARLWFGVGAQAWSDDPEAHVLVRREDANDLSEFIVDVFRTRAEVADPADLRLSGSGPVSATAVLAQGHLATGGAQVDPARLAAQQARSQVEIDVDGDVIEAAARAVGDDVYARIGNGSIAAITAAKELARLRSWVDPFTPTPQTGVLVGEPRKE
ncbi:MAG: hypothetical protein KDB70_05630 [Mycobacterium sp.]|nr:hypothetical protein [Mycobacterium sp.]